MTKRLLVLVAVLALCSLAGTASAQLSQEDCLIGVYGDEGGTISVIEPTQGEAFTVYVLMFVEAQADAVAYDLFVPRLSEDIFIVGESFGAAGRGINIFTDGAYNVGLGDCVVGFGGFPIMVAQHTFLMPFETTTSRTISVGPNPTWDDQAPLYSICTGDIFPCTINDNLLLTRPVDTETTSFGAVKNLYHD